jgi:YggT family protein
VITRIVVDLLQVYLVILFVRILLTWVPVDPWSRAAKAIGWLGVITDPLLRPLRRMIPPLRLGSVMLDLSPIIVIVAVEILIGIFGGSRMIL